MSQKERGHHILILTEDQQLQKDIETLFREDPIAPVQKDDGRDALNLLKSNFGKFPVILVDHAFGNMKPIVFLEHAKAVYPFSSLFMIGENPDIDLITKAVNQGLIQRFVDKKTDMDDLPGLVRRGIKAHESHLDHQRLLKLAKKQNTNLYELNCELMEKTKSHSAALLELEDEIQAMEKKLTDLQSRPTDDMENVIQEIKDKMASGEIQSPDGFAALFNAAARNLFEQFNDYAHRNGFEMPVPRRNIQ